MPTPETFESSLRNYDPALSLRWGHHVKAWVVDRKGRVSQALWDTLLWAEQQPNCEPLDRERVVSAKLGCRPVLHTPVLGNHVFNELWQNDIQVHGMKIVDRHMKHLEDERIRKRNDDTSSRMAAEGLDFLGRRRADPTPDEQRRVFEEVAGRSFSDSKARRKVNKAIVDPAGVPVNPADRPAKKIQVATR